MNLLTRNILTALLLVFSIAVSAQENDPQRMLESIIESQLDNIDEETDASLIIEDLEKLLDKPININNCRATDLSKLYLLNPIMIERLLNYVQEFGPVYSIFELNTIDGFTPDLLRNIEPFIAFGPAPESQPPLKQQLKYGHHEILTRSLGTVQTPRGYKTNDDGVTPYEGNRFRYYTRYRYEVSDRLSLGLTAEKDPGEAFFKGSNQRGFDFYSAHLSLQTNHTVEQFMVGDFSVRAGQGLVLWQGYSTGKSVDVLGLAKTGQGIRPYTSVSENSFFRGAASSLRFGKHKIILFASQRKADGNIETDENGKTYFTSLQTSGYHRTASENEDENAVKTRDAGAVFTFNFPNLKIGINGAYQDFDKPFIRSSQLYNQYRFSGTENYSGSIDYLFTKGKYQFFGEAAISKSKGIAYTQGAIARLNDQLSFSALYRHFDKNYHALWASAFSEGSTVSNESGLYVGTRVLPVKYLTLSAYVDFYRSPWTNYSTIGPSKGWDILAQADVRISQKFSFYLRYKNEEKDQKNKSDLLYINLPERTQKIRTHFDIRISEQLKSRTRLEYAHFEDATKENGYMVFQDLQYSPLNFPLNLSLRGAWFNTDSYNSRIYAYENDLLFTFAVPAYYDKGFRTYLNLKYQIAEQLELWCKIANTHWTNKETISSGYNEIEGSDKTELKIQLRLKF